MDMISDVYMISVFFEEGQTSIAIGNICMIGINWLMQLIIVYLQTGRNAFGGAFWKEALIMTVGFKP
jgi:hypothetical protein